MLNWDNKDVIALGGAGTTVKIKNESKKDKVVLMYVLNKDSIPTVLPAGKEIDVVCQSSGEIFTYLNQADDDLSVEAV